MLPFLWLGTLSLDLPILEKDVLHNAQTDSFGYVKEHTSTLLSLLQSKSWQSKSLKHIAKQLLPKLSQKIAVCLRPVNVPFKNKWLREASRDLDIQIKLNLIGQHGQYPLYRRIDTTYEGHDLLVLVRARLVKELGGKLITESITLFATKIGDRLLKKLGRAFFESIFEYLSCFLLALKLQYGLNDLRTENIFVQKLQSSFKSVLSHQTQELPLWRNKSLPMVTNVKEQIDFADRSIWSLSSTNTVNSLDPSIASTNKKQIKKDAYEQRIHEKVNQLSLGFSNSLQRYRQSQPAIKEQIPPNEQ